MKKIYTVLPTSLEEAIEMFGIEDVLEHYKYALEQHCN